MMKRHLVLIFCLMSNPSFAEVLDCRTQIIFGLPADYFTPADISLNLTEQRATFCRGETCDDFKIILDSRSGSWDDRVYTSFSLLSDDKSFTVSGVVFPEKTAFAASSSELGNLAGSCTTEE